MNKKILIIGPSWVGDMVMAQVLFKLIKQQNPTAQIDVLAPEWSQEILPRIPEIAKNICLPIAHGELGLKKRYQIAKQLKQEAYDQAYILTNSWKSALIPWLARIPIRTGWLGECRWGLINDMRYLNKKALPKMVQRYAALAFPAKAILPAELPAPKLSAPYSTVAAVLDKFKLQIATPILALCPGAAYGPAKRWLPEYYIQIAQNKLDAGWQVWFFGSQQDAAIILDIQRQLQGSSISFAGKINLLETVDLMSQASSVVTNDSGLLHIAASLDKPLVAIYGSTSPKFTPPLGQKVRVLSENLACSPCFKRECPLGHFNCMRMIKPEQVLDALTSLEQV
jgi:heptosyltransferase-2